MTGVPQVSPPQLVEPCWREPLSRMQQTRKMHRPWIAAVLESKSQSFVWLPKALFCLLSERYRLLCSEQECKALSKELHWEWTLIKSSWPCTSIRCQESWGQLTTVHMVSALLTSVPSFSSCPSFRRKVQQLLEAQPGSGTGALCAAIGLGFTPKSATALGTLQNRDLEHPNHHLHPSADTALPPTPGPGQGRAASHPLQAGCHLWALDSPHLLGLPCF